jgi:DNA-binding transcriptional MerR regulator
MSARNIRAHQARGLLAQPTRVGRVAYYNSNHVHRIEAIQNLQQQGFNLVSIASILGVVADEDATPGPGANLERFWTDHPALTYALLRHGVLVKGADGTARVARPRLLRAAFGLRQAGISPAVTLQALVSMLERLRSQADDLVQELAACVLAAAPSTDRTGRATWEDLDQETIAFTQAIIVMLADAFQTVVERSGHQHLPDLIAEHSGVSFPAEGTAVVDVG